MRSRWVAGGAEWGEEWEPWGAEWGKGWGVEGAERGTGGAELVAGGAISWAGGEE